MSWEAAGAIGEVIGAFAVVASLAYLAVQIRMSNRLSRAEASRMPNSELNSVNAAFGTDPLFRTVIRKVLSGASRTDLEEGERLLVDYYLISITNVYEQLEREIEEGILGEDTRADFGGKGLFLLPYYQSSWPLYREHLSSRLVRGFEERYGLDASIEAAW